MSSAKRDIKHLTKLSDDEYCMLSLKRAREERGIECNSCASSGHYWLESKHSFQCKDCRYRTTLKSGTLLQGSKLPYSYWFKSVYFINRYPKLSAYELQHLLGHKFYEPVWALMKKVKSAMDEEDFQIEIQKSSEYLAESISEVLCKARK